MKIFKFGGASVRSAESIRHLATILKDEKPPVVIVISAMGKTTNALEALVNNYFNTKVTNSADALAVNPELEKQIMQIRHEHEQIAGELFGDPQHPVFNEIRHIFSKMREKIKAEPSMDYDYEYDQLVVYGELLSTKIVAAYLQSQDINVAWKDIRKIIKTDATFRNARVNMELTQKQVHKHLLSAGNFTLVQGFIAASPSNINTTLGREGSDFSASLLGYFLDASEVVIWKDVPGVFNADPKHFKDAVKLDAISFREAVELAYFGAKIIHPKTIKPLQNKSIPLQVKSFINPHAAGTLIADFNNRLVCRAGNETPPAYIIKENQILISISPDDFSFIVEENISRIFALLAHYHLQVNLMQHGAISFSICLDNTSGKIRELVQALRQDFRVLYNSGLQLVTIRHYTDAAIERMTAGKTIYVQQKSRKTARYIIGNKPQNS